MMKKSERLILLQKIRIIDHKSKSYTLLEVVFLKNSKYLDSYIKFSLLLFSFIHCLLEYSPL